MTTTSRIGSAEINAMHAPRITALASIVWMIAMTVTTAGVAAEVTHETAARVAAFVDAETLIVLHADLARADLDALLALRRRFQSLTESQLARKTLLANLAPSLVARMQDAGVSHAFGLVSLADIENLSIPIIMPVERGKDPDAVARLFGFDATVTPSDDQAEVDESWEIRITTTILDDVLVSGKRGVVDRLRQVVSTNTGRRDAQTLVDGLSSVYKAPIHFMLWPSEDHRRVIREIVPELDWPIEGISGEILADGIVWMAIGLNPAAAEAYVVARAENEVAAARLAQAIESGLDSVAKLPESQEAFENANAVLSILNPTQDGRSLRWRIDLNSVEFEQILDLVFQH